jgi:hypothetical protein
MGEQGRLMNRRFRIFLVEFKSLMGAYITVNRSPLELWPGELLW